MSGQQEIRGKGLFNFVQARDGGFAKPALPKANAENLKFSTSKGWISHDVAAKPSSPRTVTLNKHHQSTRLGHTEWTGSPSPRALFDSEYEDSETTTSDVYPPQVHRESNATVPFSARPANYRTLDNEQMGSSSPGREDQYGDNDSMDEMIHECAPERFALYQQSQLSAQVPESYPSTTDGVLSQGDEDELIDRGGYSHHNNYEIEDQAMWQEQPHVLAGIPKQQLDQNDNRHMQPQIRDAMLQLRSQLHDGDVRDQRAAELRQDLNNDFHKQQHSKLQQRQLSPFDRKPTLELDDDHRGHLSQTRDDVGGDTYSAPTTPTRQRNSPVPKRKPAPPSPSALQIRKEVKPKIAAVEAPMPTIKADTSTLQQLDYEPTALFAMDFERLQEESFDSDPCATPFILPDSKGPAPLAERLNIVAKLTAEDQRQFLDSLDISEWEQSGDWFKEQFQQLMDRMRKSRQERRTIAREFEKEISERHDVVVKEQGSLAGALAGMKKSGGAVLDSSTPKRKRG